ncbi:MAG: sulfatase [Planctomycetota bacterium]
MPILTPMCRPTNDRIRWLFLVALTHWFANAPADAARPNVVVFFVDDMGWFDSSTYGSAFYETPTLDRLASEGVTFRQAYAHPLCSPSRAALLSGQYPGARMSMIRAITGSCVANPTVPETQAPHQSTCWPGSADRMPMKTYTLAESLRDQGYQTWHLGKWHLCKGRPGQGLPDEQGFDKVIGVGGAGPTGGYFAPYSVPRFPQGTQGEYISERMALEACNLLKRRESDKPFFMYYACFNVHAPYECTPDLLDYYEKKLQSMPKENTQRNPVMAAMLHAMDQSLKTLLDKLDSLGLAENTIVIFASDNGGVHFPMKGRSEIAKPFDGVPVTDNGPLRGGKCSWFEGGVRVPMVIRWPGHSGAGHSCETPVHLIDLYPTLLGITGSSPRPGQVLDGVDMSPLLTGETIPERPLYCHFPRTKTTVDQIPGGSFIRSGDYKLVRVYDYASDTSGRKLLFNLKDDLGETKNLAEELPEVVLSLEAQLDAWLAETNAMVPRPNPRYDPVSSPQRKRRVPSSESRP